MMADSDLQRTHPATVAVQTVRNLYRVGLWFIVVVVFGSSGGGRALPALGAAALIGLTIIVINAAVWISWWRFRYGIVDSDLLIAEGMLIRKKRTIPIARVHGVNLKADPLMRMLGLVEVVVQTAGGGTGEPEATIGAIPLDRAEELRSALLSDIASGAPDTSATQDPALRLSDFRGAFGGSEVTGHEVRFEHRVPFGRLVVGELTSNRVPVILALGLAAASQLFEIAGGDLIDRTASRAAEIALPILVALIAAFGVFAVGVAVAVGIARDFGFVARRYATRVEIEAGLLERRQISLPVGRVQAVRIEESWLRRLLGLAAIHVDTAGLERGGQDGREALGSKAMVPIARAVDVAGLMHELLPEAEEFPREHGVPGRALRFYVLLPTVLVIAAGLASTVPASWFLYRPALPWAIAAALLAGMVTAALRTLEWRRAGVGTDEYAVSFRSGVLGIKRVRLTRSRIQSLDIRQNPFQRRARLASLRTASISGASQTSYGVAHLDEAEALRIMHWYEDGLARPSYARSRP